MYTLLHQFQWFPLAFSPFVKWCSHKQVRNYLVFHCISLLGHYSIWVTSLLMKRYVKLTPIHSLSFYINGFAWRNPRNLWGSSSLYLSGWPVPVLQCCLGLKAFRIALSELSPQGKPAHMQMSRLHKPHTFYLSILRPEQTSIWLNRGNQGITHPEHFLRKVEEFCSWAFSILNSSDRCQRKVEFDFLSQLWHCWKCNESWKKKTNN